MQNKKVKQTSGGQYLEQLRKKAKLNKAQVARWSETENYAKYESGERPYPDRDTVERILKVLATRFSERKETLQRFGYVVNTPAPTQEEITWACNVCKPIMDRLPFPSYLLDQRGYMLEWNALIPKVLSISDSHMRFAMHPERLTLYQSFFDSRMDFASRFENAERFLAYTIGVMRQEYEYNHYFKEEWCQELLETSFRRYPQFKQYWDMAENWPDMEIPARPLGELRIKHQTGTLVFRIAMERPNRDTRFRVIYGMPGDVSTMERCEVWKKEAAQAAQI